MHVEILARHELEPVEKPGQQNTQIFLDVRRRGVPQGLRDFTPELVDQLAIDHVQNCTGQYPRTSLELDRPIMHRVGAIHALAYLTALEQLEPSLA